MEHLRRLLTVEEVQEIVTSGVRPVYFQENEDSYIWGTGTCFILSWRNQIFAITAKHVVEKPKADYKHTRIVMPGSQIAIPINGVYLPSFPSHPSREEVEDFVIFHLESELYLEHSGVDLLSWDLNRWVWPASKLAEGTQLCVAGFPANDDRFDWENRKLNEICFTQVGYLEPGILGPDTHQIWCGASDIKFNGMSGSPVFARINGFVYFVGLIVRGGHEAGVLHFIGAEVIRDALNWTVDQIKQKTA